MNKIKEWLIIILLVINLIAILRLTEIIIDNNKKLMELVINKYDKVLDDVEILLTERNKSHQINIK